MSDPAPTRTSAAKAGWLIGLLFAAWLAFLLAPRFWEPAAPEPEPVVKRAPTRLAALGLEDISDLEQVPEMFAIWASFGEWHNDRTRFAYWSPGALDYVYNIEARRTPEGYRFRMIGKPTDAELGEELAADCPLRFFRAPAPKVVHVRRDGQPPNLREIPVPPRVPVEIAEPTHQVPPVDIKVELAKPPPKK